MSRWLIATMTSVLFIALVVAVSGFEALLADVEPITQSDATPYLGPAMVVGTLVLLLATLLSLLVGSRVLSVSEVVGGLVGTDQVAAAVIWQLRLPRTIVGLVVGAALGAAGVLAQAVTRNPLADPGLLGISSGAAVAIVTGSLVFGVGGGVPRVLLAVAGAAVATAMVYLFAHRAPDGLTPVNMTLAGMAITACLGGIIRDVLAGEPSILLRPEIYVTAAALAAGLFVGLILLGAPLWPAATLAALAGFALRGVAIARGLALPGYRD